ncbi:MAG: metallophosphoesterase [Actinomycetota bacterium]|nr:metallophosphoesterase [Actinomycetota bacterium]
MPVYVIADLHGASDALDGAVPQGATLLLLGDLVNFLDYISMTGILTEVFSVETVSEVVDLRTAGRIEEARAVMRERSRGREDEIRTQIGRLVTRQYEEVFAALPDPTYLILGNVDNPALAEAFAKRTPAARLVTAGVVELEGERFGLVGGALPTPLDVAGEVPPEEMRARIDSLGEVDVLCSHIPPSIPELCFDTVSGKREQGSDDLLEYICDVQPRRAYFGHVHQPLVSVMTVGRTVCVNVGYFRSTRRAFPHQRRG